MHRNSLTGVVISLAFCFASSAPARGEENAKGQTTQPATQTRSPVQDKKAVLLDATRVSTDKAVEGASKNKTKEESAKESPNPSEDSAVTELRPAPPGQDTARSKNEGTDARKKSKGGPLKDIHGTVHGNTESGGQSTGAAAGASTRSRKTSIYVEAQRDKNSNPRH